MSSSLAGIDPTEVWDKKHPDQWGEREVIAWLTRLVQTEPDMEFNLLHLEKFKSCTGKQLQEMDLQEFIDKEPRYGRQIHQTFHAILEACELKFVLYIVSKACLIRFFEVKYV